MQEQDGAYGAIVIEPKAREPFKYVREHVVLISDSHDHGAMRILSNLKKMPDYYNRQQRTVDDFLRALETKGLDATLSGRLDWGGVRMPTTESGRATA